MAAQKSRLAARTPRSRSGAASRALQGAEEVPNGELLPGSGTAKTTAAAEATEPA